LVSVKIQQDTELVRRFDGPRRRVSELQLPRCEGGASPTAYKIVHTAPPPSGYVPKTPLLFSRHIIGHFGHLQDYHLPPYPLDRISACLKQEESRTDIERFSVSYHMIGGRMSRNWPTGHAFNFRCPAGSIFLGFSTEFDQSPPSGYSAAWTPFAIVDTTDLANGVQLKIAHSADGRLPPHAFTFYYYCATRL